MNRLYTSVFTVPAKTTAANPATLAVVLEDNRLDKIRFVVPAGHIGLTGIRIQSAGTQLVPLNPGGWLTTDNDKFEWEFAGEVNANGMTLAGYNTDARPHTFFVWWYISDLPELPAVAISSPQAAGSSADTGQVVADLTGSPAGNGSSNGSTGSTSSGGTDVVPAGFHVVTVPKAETFAALVKALKWKPAQAAEVASINGITLATKLAKGERLDVPDTIK